MPIKSGFLTQHPINSKYVQRGVATVIIRDLKSDKVAVLRAIQENDYTSNKTGGVIYNEFLTEVCEFKFLATSNALINCRHYGAFGAEFEITNLFKGEYKLFGKNEDYALFCYLQNWQKILKPTDACFICCRWCDCNLRSWYSLCVSIV